MRRRLIVPIAAVLVIVAGFVAWRAGSGDSDDGRSAAGAVTALVEHTMKAGDVTVKIEPRRLDAGGAVFKIAFDTHTVELDQDVARSARLEVGGVEWPGATWDGDGPSGHHREGELRFPVAGTATDAAILTLSGLPEPVTASWETGA